eukprot:TRINITY_DN8509_c0_g1_i1.p1 TRINITY_DN8509_c0_g1~~TRINITY_DN8509_c0_g1_i1.p1  ORF type:complete len:142 (-),score=8.71 TRINITY_DN8509_c0_g1_i1:112-537(-)
MQGTSKRDALGTTKLFAFHTRLLIPSGDKHVFSLGKREIGRVWIQGTVVSFKRDINYKPGFQIFVDIDDGTGIVSVYAKDSPLLGTLGEGSYVMVVGYFKSEGDKIVLQGMIIIFNDNPNRETLWMLEVIDIHKNAYLTLK